MKRIIGLLLAVVLIVSLASAQATISVTVKPNISCTTIGSIYTTSGKDTITAVAKPFGSVTAGMQVYGPGIKNGTTVAYKVTGDSVLVLSDTAIATAAGNASLQFPYFTSAAYSTGQWVGLPFKVMDNYPGALALLISAEIEDNADIIGNMDILFFTNLSGSAGLDRAALAVPATDQGNILGIVSLTTVTDLGSLRILTSTDPISIALPVYKPIWARLIARSGATPTAISNFNVRLRLASIPN